MLSAVDCGSIGQGINAERREKCLQVPELGSAKELLSFSTHGVNSVARKRTEESLGAWTRRYWQWGGKWDAGSGGEVGRSQIGHFRNSQKVATPTGHCRQLQ